MKASGPEVDQTAEGALGAAISAELSYSKYQLAATTAEILSRFQPELKRVLLLGVTAPASGQLFPGVEFVCAEIATDAWENAEQDHLPYGDNQFSFVVACDTLDQMPFSARDPFLRELARVTSLGLLLISPFDAQVIYSAEESLNEIHQSTLGQPHPGIARHRAYRLPFLTRTKDIVASAMGHAPEILPNTSLRSWALFEMLDCVAQTLDRENLLFARLHGFFNAHLALSDHAKPVYRHALLSLKDPKLLKAPVVRSLRQRFYARGAQAEIETVRQLLRLILDGYIEVLASPPPKGVLSETMRRVEELERKTRIQARTIEKLNDEIFSLKSSQNAKTPVRLLKKLFTF